MTRPRHRRPARGPLGVTLLAALLALAVLAWGGSSTLSGWSRATVVNTANVTGTGTVAISHAYAGEKCAGAAQVPSVACTGVLAPTGSASTTPSATDVITNDSVAAPAQAYQEQVAADSCGLVQLKNSIGNDADPMLPRSGTSFQASDPWSGNSAISLDGTSGYASEVSQTVMSGSLLGSKPAFSIGVWFNAPAGSHGGGLLSLSGAGNAAGTGGGNPVIWMDASGAVHFGADFGGLLGSGQTSVGSTTDYRGKGWHLATLTVTTGGGLLGLSLSSTLSGYIDGAVAGTSADSLGVLSTGASGYWHAGWADLTGWSAAGAPYFDGSLAGAYFMAGTAQTANTIKSAHDATTSSAYISALGSPTSLWMLGDDGTTTGSTPAYAATPPGTTWLPTQPVCSTVNLTWTLGGATGYSGSLSAMPSSWWPTTAAVGPTGNGGSQTGTLTTSRGSNYVAAEAGLLLDVPLRFQIWPTGGTGWVQSFRWPVDDAQSAFVA